MRREYPDRPVVAVGAFIVKDGKVLLTRRAQEPHKGLWTVPGGVVELGETLMEAVAREVKEETGLEIGVGDVVTVVDRINADEDGRLQYHYVIIDYAVRWVGGEVAPGSDVDAARWMVPEDIEDPLIRRLAREAVEQIENLAK